jgi:hypothetical protein
LLPGRWCEEDRQVLRTDFLAVAGRRIRDVHRGALGHLRHGVCLVRAGERRVVGEGPVAARASPSSEKSRDSTDGRANQHEESTETSTVEGKWSLIASYVEATVATDGRRASRGAFFDTVRMTVDQSDQHLPIRRILIAHKVGYCVRQAAKPFLTMTFVDGTVVSANGNWVSVVPCSSADSRGGNLRRRPNPVNWLHPAREPLPYAF